MVCQNSFVLIVRRFKKPFSVRVHKSITASSLAQIIGIELMQGINMWPGTPKDMIDHLIAGYSTGLVALIDTITNSGLNGSLSTNPGPKMMQGRPHAQLVKRVSLKHRTCVSFGRLEEMMQRDEKVPRDDLHIPFDTKRQSPPEPNQVVCV